MKEKEIELTHEEIRQMHINNLSILCEIDRVCRKNGLDYSLDGGTLIGAARDGHFIPWDDDADVIMTRHQYAEFRRACRKDLDSMRFFLQDVTTDPEYRWRYAKVRLLGTEFVRPNQSSVYHHQELYADIMIMDNVPDNPAAQMVYDAFNYCTRKILYSPVGAVEAKSAGMRGWYNLLSKIPKEMVFRAQNRIWSAFNRKNGKLVSHNGFPYQVKPGAPKEIFEKYGEIELEGIRFKVIKEYDRYLRMVYGDYTILPPPEKRTMHTHCTRLKLLPMTVEEIRARYGK